MVCARLFITSYKYEFFFQGGAFLDPAGKEGSTNLMVSLLDEGTENFNGNKYKLSLKEMEQKFHSQQIKIKLKVPFKLFPLKYKRDFGYCLNQLITHYLILRK